MSLTPRLLLMLSLFAICLLQIGCSSSSSSNTPVLPERIIFTGIGTHGIFDPAITRDPSNGRLWMSYSAVDPSLSWPTQNYDVVSTRLAYSTNYGSSWTDSGTVVNAVLDVTLPRTAPNAGTWINEVSQLIYDPGAVAGERWKLMWHHYLLINGTRSFVDGWIALKMASTPEGLAAATEIKLFGAYLYDAANNTAGGTTLSPVGGAPLIQLNTALDAALNTCVFSEPGMYATNDALYLSMLCVHIPDINRQIVLFKCSSPCNTGSASSWTYLGTALQASDAAALGFDTGFSAPGLFEAGGAVNLVVTPVQTSDAPWPDYYSGCRIFRFANLDTAQLQTTGAQPTLIDSVNGTTGSFNGACTYHTSASYSGMLYSELNTSVTDRFQIYKSHNNCSLLGN